MRRIFFTALLPAMALNVACESGENLYIRPLTGEITVTAAETTRTVTVVSSIDWQLSIPLEEGEEEVTWISADRTGGIAGDSTKVNITVKTNTGAARTATVLLSGDGASAVIRVTQEASIPGVLTGPGKTNLAYADIFFTPFGGDAGLEHKLFIVGGDGQPGAVAASGTSSAMVFEVDITVWDTYTFAYGAGYTTDDVFTAEAWGDRITVEFAEPEEAAVLTIDEGYDSDLYVRLIVSGLQEGVEQYQIFRNGEPVEDRTIAAATAYTDVNSPGIYSVRAILSRQDVEPAVYGPASNEVEVTLNVVPPPVGG